MPASTAINLLTLVDPARDADGDGWLLSDGQLRNRIEPGKLSYLQLPYRPPAEYDLTIRYRRLDEMGGMVGVILPYNGTQVMAYLSFRAWEQKKLMGLGQVGRLGIVDPPNPTRVSVGGGDQHGRPYQGVIRVRRDRIRIEYEGFTSEWTPAAGELSLEPAWRKIAPGAFALAGGRGSTVFEQVTLLSISGTGEERRPTQPVRETARALDGATP